MEVRSDHYLPQATEKISMLIILIQKDNLTGILLFLQKFMLNPVGGCLEFHEIEISLKVKFCLLYTSDAADDWLVV